MSRTYPYTQTQALIVLRYLALWTAAMFHVTWTWPDCHDYCYFSDTKMDILLTLGLECDPSNRRAYRISARRNGVEIMPPIVG